MENELLRTIDQKCASFEPIAKLSHKFGVKPIVVAGVGVSFLLGFLLFGTGGSFAVNLVGFLYPAFESFKALEGNSVEGMQFWLTYWLVFSSFVLLEAMIDYLLFWVPLYYLLKLVFLLWLFLPMTRGATVVYTNVIAPLLRTHKNAIDAFLTSFASRQ